MSETLSTLRTNERPLSSVKSNVNIKVSFLSVTLSAVIARVRLFSGVKRLFYSETFSTLRAFERLLSRMDLFFLVIKVSLQ